MDKKHKIYAKKAAPTPAFHLPARKDRGEPIQPSQRIRGPLRLGTPIKEHRPKASAESSVLSARPTEFPSISSRHRPCSSTPTCRFCSSVARPARISNHSARKWAENAVRDSEERYRTLFDLGPVAVYSCDAAGVIQKFNRRAVELWGREPAPGDTDQRFCGSFKMFRPDGRFMPHEQCPMAEVVAGTVSEVRDGEVLIERPDGTRVTVVVNIQPLKDQRGEVTGAINCFYDITERKRAEEAMRESDRHKNEFLAMLAHELRNPLAPILVSIEVLRRAKGVEGADLQNGQGRADGSTTHDLSDRIDHALDVLQRQAGQMVRLVDDLLDAGRINLYRFSAPLRQGLHSQQGRVGSTTMRSPTATDVTPSPSSSTTPVAS